MRSQVWSPLCLVDVAVNLTDPLFRGVDHKGKRRHEEDFSYVMERAAKVGVRKMLVTGTSYAQCVEAIQLCREHMDTLRCTVGIHPAHCTEFEKYTGPPYTDVDGVAEVEEKLQQADLHLSQLVQLIERNRDVVVAVGEIGIDYAELHSCPREVQHTYFRRQLEAYYNLGLPFLLHSRECGDHFIDILEAFAAQHAPHGMRGVVHSFNGSLEEQERVLQLGLSISLNGTAFRTRELASQVVKIPLDRLLLETDAPWCDIRKTDFGYAFVKTFFETNPKKGKFELGKCVERRNEPCHLVQVVEAYMGSRAALLPDERQPSFEELVERVRLNCSALFNLE